MIKKIFAFLVLFIVLERFCHYQTEGFQVHKVTSDLAYDPQWEVEPLAPEAFEAVSAQLSQPYTFLGSGGQFYTFLSADGHYVMKVFKHHHMRVNSLFNRFKLPGDWDKYRCKLLGAADSPEKRLTNLFMSCKLAYEQFKEESGLLYLHLNKTKQFGKQLTLIDKLGIAHVLDLDSLEFVLQKKADLIYPTLKTLIRQNNYDAAKQALDSLVTLISTRSQKGILDTDAVIKKNFGFINGKAIVIDIGCFKPDQRIHRASQQELLLETAALHKWLRKRHPQLANDFELTIFEK